MDKDYLIKKWLDNSLTEAEEKAFMALEDSHLYEEISQEAQRFKGDAQSPVPQFEVLEQTLNSKKQSRSSLHWLKIAASMAAILAIGFFVYQVFTDNVSTYNTDYAQKETITLPDNSVVSLNELSELHFNTSNWDEQRVLELNGEAFFDVEKGKRFDVNTKLGRVSVLGTEFNVLSRDSIFKVSCYEGLVKVTYKNESLELPAGSEVIFKTEKTQKETIVVAEPYWLKGLSVFENTALGNVILELEKQD